MYFPYFRGRQYELLALKELAVKKLITNSVVPVIEPVKLIPALNNSLKAFNSSNLSIGLILNPNVGDLTDEPKTIDQLLNKMEINSKILPSILLNANTETVISKLEQKNIRKSDTLVVLDNQDYLVQILLNSLFALMKGLFVERPFLIKYFLKIDLINEIGMLIIQKTSFFLMIIFIIKMIIILDLVTIR